MTKATEMARKMGLFAHPEGGFFRETYRSADTVSVNDDVRSTSTAIAYLLPGGEFSAWHKLTDSNETWAYSGGDPLTIYIINDAGALKTHRLGTFGDAHPKINITITKNQWFAAKADGEPVINWTLSTCVCAPAFRFSGFVLGDRDELIRLYPEHKELITTLTRDTNKQLVNPTIS